MWGNLILRPIVSVLALFAFPSSSIHTLCPSFNGLGFSLNIIGITVTLSVSHTHLNTPPRASDPEEIYKIHELKQKAQQAREREEHLDHLIQLCKQQLSLLAEDQENWQYPPLTDYFLLKYYVVHAKPSTSCYRPGRSSSHCLMGEGESWHQNSS